MNALPIPDREALVHSQQLSALIVAEIEAAGGWIDFAHYMQLCLYAPGLGYYSGGAKKFGLDGDFVTAPEISPLFAQTLARQVTQVLQIQNLPIKGRNILELGAGSGRLAADLLLALQQQAILPERYSILEVSAFLREIQRQTLQKALPETLMQRIEWLEKLPSKFSGLILGNEVLDALPVHIVKKADETWHELGVIWNGQVFTWSERPASDNLFKLISKLELPNDYLTELCPAASGLVASLANSMQQGVILFIDYGFSRAEYYHPQRSSGTLMCHYRHFAHQNPFLYPGLQDITAHVDFTTIAETAVAADLQLHGYLGQAQFLINCGITDLLGQTPPTDLAEYLPLAAQAQKLLSPAEMGELFKVIVLGKGIQGELLGFAQGDKSHYL